MDREQRRLERLADKIHDACLLIDPVRLENLLRGVDEDDAQAMVCILERKRTFQMVSLIGNIFRDYGQWRDTGFSYRRRREVLHMAALLDRYLEARPLFQMGFDIPNALREDAMIFADVGDSDEDILGCPRCDLVREGVRDIDIDLYLAFCRLDYDAVRDLVFQGADPEAVVSEGESASCLAHRNVDLTIKEIWDLLKGERKVLKSTDTLDLVELGAYDTMLRLFSRRQSAPTSGPGARLQPDEVQVPQFVFDFPEVGWCDAHFLADGRTRMEINISDVYEPFPEILEWCRGLLSARESRKLEIDCERYTAVLSYTPLESETWTGIFSVTDNSGVEDGFSVKVRLLDLVNNLTAAVFRYRDELLEWDGEGNDFRRLRSLCPDDPFRIEDDI